MTDYPSTSSGSGAFSAVIDRDRGTYLGSGTAVGYLVKMLTGLTIRNFKKLEDVRIELGQNVVFIGPNNSGKSTALQALTLWNFGLKRWNEKRLGKETPKTRPGVTINRRDLFAVPVPNINLLWRDLHVRDSQKHNGKKGTQNVRIEIVVDGVTSEGPWSCGFEFDYANQESFYCRPLRTSDGTPMIVPRAADGVEVVFLPPMSGLAANETRLDPGAVNVRIGEGRTADVLRNLCHMVSVDTPDRWERLSEHVKKLFGVDLDPPDYVVERGEISMTYRENRIRLDLSSAGRGLQQTLLLLAHLYTNPSSILLLDEPDVHLEILRQRQIYQLLTEVAAQQDCQVIAASHSEIILNEAAERDVVVAFVGKPHRIDDRGSQLLKSLKSIGFEDYYQAEITGWVLYVEGSTDLAILRAFAQLLKHPVEKYLERPLVQYIGNLPQKARDHFFGLREAKPDLVGIAVLDRPSNALQESPPLEIRAWRRREIENYLTSRTALLSYAESQAIGVMAGPLFENHEKQRLRNVMTQALSDITDALAKLYKPNPFSGDIKASDEFLTPLFHLFFQKLGLPEDLMQKSDFHTLVKHVPENEVDPEVREKLDAILIVAEGAHSIPPI
jgi:ABC-type transport system involved in cytochrome c biogenesis ATPase subunit